MNESTWISLVDLKRLYLRAKSKMRQTACLATCVLLIYLLCQPVQFTAKASFKLGKEKIEQSLSHPLLQTASFAMQDKDSLASLVLLSKNVLGRSLQKLGLQAAVSSNAFSLIKRPYKLLLSELRAPLTEDSSFRFQDLSYAGEKTHSFYLRPLSSNTYEILDSNKERLSFGKLEERITFEDISFSLQKFPTNVSLGKLYTLHIHPLENVVDAFKSHISIKPHKKVARVLLLSMTHPDRMLGSHLLNTLMQTYQDVLEEENQLMAEAQIAYLDKKHKELSLKFDQEIDEHASYLKKNLGEQGFISLSQEIDMLAPPKEAYLSKLFDVEFELARFQTPPTTLTHTETEPLLHLATVSAELKDATLALDLIHEDTAKEPQKDTLAFLLDNVQNTKTLIKNASPEEQGAYKTELLGAQAKLENYLKDLISSLTLRKKTLQELSSPTFSSHFQGIDLNSAKELYISYNAKLDSLQAELTQLSYVGEQLPHDNFNLSSIGTILSDNVTDDIIRKTSDIELQLKDSLTHSYKEHERLKDALKIQKKFLSSHLEQVQELKKIQLHLTQDKMNSLQHIIVDLLKIEKKLLREKLSDLHLQMSDLPEKWRFENKLQFKNELTKDIMQGLVQVSESKQLTSHLYQVDAKPLETATPPSTPNYPYLLISALATFFTFYGMSYLYYFFKSLAQGMPVSLDTLKSLGEPTAGSLSLQCEAPFLEITQNDHETLRLLAASLEKHKTHEGLIAGLFLSTNTNYSHNLAHILHARGHKILIFECDFESIPSNDKIPGLYHYLSKISDTLPIKHFPSFDEVPFGHKLLSHTEIFTKEIFSSLLNDLKARYDFIFLVSRSPLKSSHNFDLLQLINFAVISFEREPLDELNIYSNWIRQKQNRYGTFVENAVKPFV